MARNIFVLKEESKIQRSEPFFEHKPPMAVVILLDSQNIIKYDLRRNKRFL